MHRALLLALCLAACGGPPREAAQPASRPATPDAGVIDPALGCVRGATDDPAACTAKGNDCHLQARAWCSGMGAPEPPDWHRQPCQCLCGPQILECQ